jgi:hypothetical protein
MTESDYAKVANDFKWVALPLPAPHFDEAIGNGNGHLTTVHSSHE